MISGEDSSGSGPRWKPALIGVALVLLAVSIALFSGSRRTGNASGSPRSAPTGAQSPHSAPDIPAAPFFYPHTATPARPPLSPSPVPVSTNDPFLVADWTANPTDLSDELPATGADNIGPDIIRALTACGSDADAPGGSGGEYPSIFPLAETRAGFTAFVTTQGPSVVQLCIAYRGGPTHGSYRFDPSNAGFDAGTALSLPKPGYSRRRLDLIVIELGQVQPDVAKMTFTLTDGSIVTGTVGGGWAFAWWPGSATAETVTEYAADGSVLDVSQPDAPTDWPPSSPLAPAPIDTSLFVVPPPQTP